MTELATHDDGGQAVAVNPITGELVHPGTLDGQALAKVLEAIADHMDRVGEFRRAIVEEVAGRADARNARKVELDGIYWEVNPPTEDVYDLGELRAALRPFVDSGVLDESVLSAITRYPPPSRPAPQVDKRELAKLWKHEDRELLAALARVRRRNRTKRTAKIVGRTLDATATEDE